MSIDPSAGWEASAAQFVASRTSIGQSLVRTWARRALPARGAIVDVGCGSGFPIAEALVEDQFQVFGIDASPTLIAEFRQKLPQADAVCEAAQESAFFQRRFDGAVSIGFLFLLDREDQSIVLRRVAEALVPGGRVLFSAPLKPCEWEDSITGRRSRSLGEREYERLLNRDGLDLVTCHVDEGENNYFEAVKRAEA